MRLPFRKKRDKKGSLELAIPPEFRPPGAGRPPLFPPTTRSALKLAQLPPAILHRIFACVCPHACDESLDTCEESANNDGCILCDLRDLSHCTLVNRAWRVAAIPVLYHSIRIDSVHYCRLEPWLSERRKKHGRGDPEDPAKARLRLLRRTVRDDPTRIGRLVQYLKTPYMLREAYHVELAQIIAVLPDLHYVDLPEGMFADEPAYATLRLEVQARCPGLRRMSYVAGSERSFALLATGQVWPSLQVLELRRLNVDPRAMRNILACLANLRALKVSHTDSLSDEVFLSAQGSPALPPLQELVLENTPRLTAAGLVGYLAQPGTDRALRVLTLKNNTGVQLCHLAAVLERATSLRTLALQIKVSEAIAANAPKLASDSLRTIRFEVSGITPDDQFASAVNSYYTYLAGSIYERKLPNIRKVFVHDETFPQKLGNDLPPPDGSLAGGRHHQSASMSSTRGKSALRISPPALSHHPPGTNNGMAGPKFSLGPMLSPRMGPRSPGLQNNAQHRLSSNNPFAPRTGALPPIQTIEVYTKSNEFGEWIPSRVNTIQNEPAAPAQSSSSRRDSSYAAEGQDWEHGATRRSLLVGSADGGFLVMPGSPPFAPALDLPPVNAGFAADPYRPRSSSGLRR